MFCEKGAVLFYSLRVTPIFLPQIKVYSELGEKPQTWDQHQKGAITTNHGDNKKEVMKFMDFSMTSQTFVKLCWAEYVFVSLSLALVIAKFFPAVHNQIVSRATRLEHQSLYWGTAVASNVFTYGVVFTLMRGLSIFVKSASIVALSAQEVIVHVILFVGAVINSGGIAVPIPQGISNNLSFCWYCCICCSQQSRAKIMRVLVLFSFMSFVYHSVMDVISVIFVLFIERLRILVLTLALFYASLSIFLILLISFVLLSLFRSKNEGDVLCHQIFRSFGSVCMFLTVFPAVMLSVVVYIVIVLTLSMKGVTGIVTGLIPSIALSAASWYIKKRLVKEVSQFDSAKRFSDYGTTGVTANEKTLILRR